MITIAEENEKERFGAGANRVTRLKIQIHIKAN